MNVLISDGFLKNKKVTYTTLTMPLYSYNSHML